MVVRPMLISSIAHCDKSLNFQPAREWPKAFPAMAWQGFLLSGFERLDGPVIDLFESSRCTWLDAVTACYPELGLGEIARLHRALHQSRPEMAREFTVTLFAAYGMRWSDRLSETMSALLKTPMVFQKWVDEKKCGVRDLAPLLAYTKIEELAPFFAALPELSLSKSQAVLTSEWFIELALMGRPLNDLLPTSNDGEAYMRRLKQWRQPRSAASDEQWRKTVTEWPWPAQVQGRWERFGDQTGLEIKIRTTSPQDLHKKLERLISIRDTWSCND